MKKLPLSQDRPPATPDAAGPAGGPGADPAGHSPSGRHAPLAQHTEALLAHAERVRACRRCPGVQPPPVLGVVPGAAIYLMGQAPGPREREVGRPFAWTAGTTLFRWFASIGADEARFRERVYMAAVIRCFPGKLAGKTGDRKPAPAEVENCRPHAGAELTLLRPRLVLAVGRLAIEQFVPCPRLEDVVGQVFPLERGAHAFDLIPLPHPSGLSRWPKVEPGKSLLPLALERVGAHPAWRDTFGPA